MTTDGPRRASPRRRRHWWYAVGTAALVALALSTRVLPVLRSDLQGYLGIGDERFGLLFSAPALSAVAAALASGVLLTRWNPVVLIRIALQLTAVGSGILALAGPDWRLFLLGLLVTGAAQGPLFIASSAYLSRLFPRNRRRVLAMNLAFQGGAGILLPALGEGALWLMRHVDGVGFFEVAHLPFGLLAVALLVASGQYRMRGAPRRPRPADAAPLRRMLSFPAPVLWLILLMAMHGAVDSTLFVWMPRFLESDAFATPLAAPGLALSGFGLSYLVSRSLLAFVPDRVGKTLLLVAPGILGGTVLALTTQADAAIWAAAGYVGGAFLWSAELPAFLGALGTRDRARFGIAFAAAQALTHLLRSGLTAGAGVLAERGGAEWLRGAMTGLALAYIAVGLGGYVYWMRWGRRDEPAAALQPAAA